MAEKTIVLGGGCFWCTEAVFQRLKGVSEVVSGFAGGDSETEPNYNSIHFDDKGHAEVIHVTYDSDVIGLETLFEVFFNTHDPTTNHQPGTADAGDEYRSIILCAEDELETANAAKEEAQKNWDKPIITEIKVFEKFFPADDSHQDFYNRNSSRVPYCQVVIDPKLEKFYKKYAELVKDD